MTKVVHCKKEPYDILVDRTTPFGNPFIIGKDGDRERVCETHGRWLEEWLLYGNEVIIGKYSNKWVYEHLYLLEDKILGCWCKPKQCHADILAKFADIYRKGV